MKTFFKALVISSSIVMLANFAAHAATPGKTAGAVPIEAAEDSSEIVSPFPPGQKKTTSNCSAIRTSNSVKELPAVSGAGANDPNKKGTGVVR